MTEREKCQLGLLYDTTFPGRDEDNLRCLDLCHEFNQMKPSDLAGREAILRKILHRVGKNVRAEQNIYISFGYNIEAGDNLFINHNCVFLDPGKITFGDNVFIGPCCGFYTAHHPIDTDLRNQMLEYAFPITVGSNVWFGGHCCVAPGVTILPGTILRGRTHIGAGCEIGPNAMLTDCAVGEETTINASQLNDSTVGSHTTVGPFAYVRPHCSIGDHCRVGDFVEMKNSSIGDGTKISHLTYVGDSDVGERVNFGCGTVTTNYDGHKKFRCTIGDDVFIGCNTNLIAPVTLGDACYTAAGSTVTDDVPAGALAIARTRQTNKEGWAARLRKSWGKK